VEIVVTTLASLIALLLGTLVTKVFQEKKLEKLGDEIKGELKETTRSIIELDNKVITLIERLNNQNVEIGEIHTQLEELFNRLRGTETDVKVLQQRVDSLEEGCRREHAK
jgi:septal ring factor EnvC (AmiA/AmiB activator)